MASPLCTNELLGVFSYVLSSIIGPQPFEFLSSLCFNKCLEVLKCFQNFLLRSLEINKYLPSRLIDDDERLEVFATTDGVLEWFVRYARGDPGYIFLEIKTPGQKLSQSLS